MIELVLEVVRFCIGAGVMFAASYSDYKTRIVENWYWIFMGLTGFTIGIIEIYIKDMPYYYMASMASGFILLMFFLSCDYIYDKEEKKVHYPCLIALLTSIIIPIYLLSSQPWDTYFLYYMSPIWMIWLYYGFYVFNMIHGGGDAKALIALSILLPIYPPKLVHMFGAFEYFNNLAPKVWCILTPSFSIMMNAAFVTIFLPIPLFIYNVCIGNISPYGFVGIKMPIDKAEKSFVWPMNYVGEDGTVKISIFPRKMEDCEIKNELKKLKEHGLEEIWVTPKIPFIISIFIGFLLLYIAGPVLFEILFLLMR